MLKTSKITKLLNIAKDTWKSKRQSPSLSQRMSAHRWLWIHLKISNEYQVMLTTTRHYTSIRWCWPLQVRLVPPEASLYELDPEVMHLFLQNKRKAAKLHNFQNCKFACKLRNWGTSQVLVLNFFFYCRIQFSRWSPESVLEILSLCVLLRLAIWEQSLLSQLSVTWRSVRHLLKGTTPVLSVIRCRALATVADCGTAACQCVCLNMVS